MSVLKRVEVYEDEVHDSTAINLVPRPQVRISGANDIGSRRYKEQGVDEILHLKLLQALNNKPIPAPRGSTIVLATGDAKGGQFNRDGFVGGVREALKRGWAVELWSFRSGSWTLIRKHETCEQSYSIDNDLGLSRAWKDVARKEGWFSKGFEVRTLDEWAEQLVEVADDNLES